MLPTSLQVSSPTTLWKLFSTACLSSEFENAERNRPSSTTNPKQQCRQAPVTNILQQHFCNEYTDFPPVSPPLSQSQQQPPLPMDQTAGSVFPTAAYQLQSAVEASTTPAVTLCSSEPTPIVTRGNPFGTLPTRVPPVHPQPRRQNSAVHPFQNDDRSVAHSCRKYVFCSTEPRICYPVAVQQSGP